MKWKLCKYWSPRFDLQIFIDLRPTALKACLKIHADTVDRVLSFVDGGDHSSFHIQPIETKFSVLTSIDPRGWQRESLRPYGGLKKDQKTARIWTQVREKICFRPEGQHSTTKLKSRLDFKRKQIREELG